jgi:DNA-binding MarR family transcriptional regulator
MRRSSKSCKPTPFLLPESDDQTYVSKIEMNGSRNTSIPDQLDRLLRDVHYNLLRLSRHELRESGLTPPRYHVLSHIVRHGEMDMGTLHKSMPVTRSTVTSLVDGLVEEQLLERHRSEEDRRRVVLRPTAKGAELLEVLRLARCAHLREALEDVDAHNQTVTRDTLKAVTDYLTRKGESDDCTRPTV